MSTIVIDDVDLVEQPARRITQAAREAERDGPGRLIVRCPDRATDRVRALREDDIGRLLQQHARVTALDTTGNGTIIAAGDVCGRRGELAVWTGWAIGPWHPSDILDRGLGGSETAAVRLAEELAAMGWAVTLYGQFEKNGLWGDVLLRDFQTYDPTRPLDALVAFRNAMIFDQHPNARFSALWLEDLPGAEQLTPGRAARVDRVCTVSRWHKQAMLDYYPWLDEKQVTACRNGIVHEYFEGEPPDRENRVIYSSSPDRGADVLLNLWPEVKEKVPDAELVLTYSRWYDIVATVYQQSYKHRERMLEQLKQPGVTRLEGGLGQRKLANLMRSCKVWAHPSWYTAGDMEFHETSCISAMEAQAAGCVVVASNWGALTETVMHGTLVNGDPRDPDGSWRELFVASIVQGLTVEKVQLAAQIEGPELMAAMDWAGAAEQLAGMFPVA